MKRLHLAVLVAIVGLILQTRLKVDASINAQPDPHAVDHMPDAAVRTETLISDQLFEHHVITDLYLQQRIIRPGGVSLITADEYAQARLVAPTFQLIAKRGKALSRLRRLSDDFVALLAPDPHHFDRDHFAFFKRGPIVLTGTALIVYDIRPRDGDDFLGEIFVEPNDLVVVRYAGTSKRINRVLSELVGRRIEAHIDGWRTELAPSHWATTRIYIEEIPGKDHVAPRFHGQLRVWGHGDTVGGNQGVATMQISGPVIGSQVETRDATPPEEDARWKGDVVRRFVDDLTNMGLAAPNGQVQNMCGQIVRVLINSNRLPLEDVDCVVLTQTAPLLVVPMDSHIFVNRTMFDVVPANANAALGAILAHALAHIMISNVADPAHLLSNRDPSAILRDLESNYMTSREIDVDRLTQRLLENSPYKRSLSETGGFFDLVESMANRLPALIGANFANHADSNHVLRRSSLMLRRPFDCGDTDVVCALPIGSRLVIGPNGQLELLKVVTLPGPGEEKNSFGVTAFFPSVEPFQDVKETP